MKISARDIDHLSVNDTDLETTAAKLQQVFVVRIVGMHPVPVLAGPHGLGLELSMREPASDGEHHQADIGPEQRAAELGSRDNLRVRNTRV